MNKCIDCKHCNECAYIHEGVILAGLIVDSANSRIIRCEDFDTDYVPLSTRKLIKEVGVSKTYYYAHLINEPDTIMYLLKKNGYDVRFEVVGSSRKYFKWYIKKVV